MSFAALVWAAKQKTGGLATKAALLALANYADEHGCAYPSTAAIAAFGEMDHKTATTALDRLSMAGLIVDTGARAGTTKQIKVYRLLMASHPEAVASPNRKPPVSAPKAPQKRGTDTVRDTISQKASPSSRPRASRLAWPVPEGIDRQHWSDFLANRKSKRLGFTETAHRGQLKALADLADDEWPPGRLVEHAAERGWGAIHDPRKSGQQHGQRPHHDRPERRQFRDPLLQRDYDAGRFDPGLG